MAEETKRLDEVTAGKISDAIYEKAIEGVPKVSRSVEEMAQDYLSKCDTAERAAKALAKIRY